MVLTPKSDMGVPEFTVFDTLITRGHPANSRRFHLPPRYTGWQPSVHVDHGRCLGTLDRDRLLITDPTQAILVLELSSVDGGRVYIIVRIQILIEHLCAVGMGDCVSWDEWGRGATVMKISMDDHGDRYPLVQGAHLILVEMDITPRLRTFDFSRRSCSILPLCGTERRALFEDGRNLSLQGGEDMTEWRLDSLGDGGFVYLVSCFHHWRSGKD